MSMVFFSLRLYFDFSGDTLDIGSWWNRRPEQDTGGFENQLFGNFLDADTTANNKMEELVRYFRGNGDSLRNIIENGVLYMLVSNDANLSELVVRNINPAK